jgi:two-component sensor histidine kinase
MLLAVSYWPCNIGSFRLRAKWWNNVVEKKTKVLVVDNDPQMLSITSRVLREAGYEVIETTTGTECLKIAGETRPLLILLNISLPDISGNEVCRIIKSTPSLSDIFIIFVTGDRATSIDKSRGLDGGADGYIARPILNDEFLSTVKAMDRIIQAETQLKKEIEEKEVLLSEIHHRVKNNMQIISSLLSLQSAKIKDKKHADMFKESRDRIRSMALIHETLYQTKDFANVDFGRHVKAIANHLFRSYGVNPEKIGLKIDMADTLLELNNAIPCGLVINELISNSLKYAFPQDGTGEIKITLRSMNQDEIELTVSDDGIGIPAEMDLEKVESMGLQLVNILVENQLEGEIDLDRDGGTAFRIRFTN